MVQEKITFHEYLLTKRRKEVHLKNDLCFKYAMQNQEVASVGLDTLGFIVKPQDITIRSEIGTGIHIRACIRRSMDHLRTGIQILSFSGKGYTGKFHPGALSL